MTPKRLLNVATLLYAARNIVFDRVCSVFTSCMSFLKPLHASTLFVCAFLLFAFGTDRHNCYFASSFIRRCSALHALDIAESDIDNLLSKRAMHLTDIQSLVRSPPRSLRYFNYTPHVRINDDNDLHENVLLFAPLSAVFETLLQAVFPETSCPVPELDVFPVIQ